MRVRVRVNVNLPHESNESTNDPEITIKAPKESKITADCQDTSILESTIQSNEKHGGSHTGKGPTEITSNAIYVVWEKDDPENPFNWPKKKKRMIATVAILITLSAAFASTCYAWAADAIAVDLHVSKIVSLLGGTTFTLGFGIAPMVLAPLSEVYGRSPLYLTTFALYTLLFIPQALSPNISCMLISRFICGSMSSTGSAMVSGTLADMYHADTRGSPMSVFSSSTLYGTALGSIVGAYTVVNPHLGWRWVFWLQLIFNLVLFLFVCVVLDETRGSILLSRRAARRRKETGDVRYIAAGDAERDSLLVLIRVSLTRPFVFLFTEPAVMAYSVWIAFTWGVLYLFLIAVPILFRSVYGWSLEASSLSFLGMVAGTTVALALAPLQDKLYIDSGKSRNGVPRPEARLYSSMVGSLFFSFGMLIFGWCAYRNVSWIGSIIGIGLASCGIFTIYLAVFNILADTYGQYASSALASQSFLRNMFGSGFPLFAAQMYNKLGVHWASFVLSIIGLLLSAVPFMLFIYGPQVRRASKYATGDQE